MCDADRLVIMGTVAVFMSVVAGAGGRKMLARECLHRPDTIGKGERVEQAEFVQ